MKVKPLNGSISITESKTYSTTSIVYFVVLI